MSGELTIRWQGAVKSFAPGTEVRIGRDPAGEFVVDNPNVSRLHAVVSHDGSGWVLRDQGSFQGTFVNGQAVTELRLGAIQQVTFGAPQVGVTIELSLEEGTAPTRVRGSDDDDVDTVVPNRETRPGGALRDDAFDAATVVGGHSLRVECGGKTYQFSPGKKITLGRDASADVVSTNPTVSRSHAEISHDGEGWKIEDTGSSAGTYMDRRRITSARLVGSTAVWLGDPETGERVVIVASGEKETKPIDRVRRVGRSAYIGIAAVVVAVLAIGLTLFALNRSDKPIERDALARGVVRIETETGIGSGTVIDAEQGLILTSAHIVEPRAEGQGVLWGSTSDELGENPREIVVWVAPGLDEVAEPRFFAEVVAVDGYLDLAVIEITRTVGGSLIEDDDLDDLVEVPIGDSAAMQSGDAIDVLGYPGIADSNAATLTTGVLAGAVQDVRLGSNRAFINLDAEIRRGNSGGLVADDQGNLVGVPTFRREIGAEDIGAMRPVELAEGLIQAARDEQPYESPYVSPLTGDEEFTAVFTASGAASGFTMGCNTRLGSAQLGASSISFQVEYEGFEEGQHQDILIGLWDWSLNEYIGWVATGDHWPVEFEGSGCFAVSVPLSEVLIPGEYDVDFFIGPNYELGGTFSFDL